MSWFVDTKGTTEHDDPEINNTKNQEIDGEIKQKMKEQWEQQERENMQKEFIHYQDVLFDGEYIL